MKTNLCPYCRTSTDAIGLIADRQDQNVIRCPICKKDPQEAECSHLLIHGDDLRTQELISLRGPAGAWGKLQAKTLRLPEHAQEFLDKFEKYFPSLVSVARGAWEGGAPGLSGNYSYVWVKSVGEFEAELEAFLKSKLEP